MGRKSSAKAHTQAGAAAPPPKDPPKSWGAPMGVAVAALVVVAGLFAYSRTGQSEDPAAPPTQTASQSQAILDPPAFARHGPHKQDNLPPLPLNPEPPARPAAVVNAAYTFAAEHPEVLSYVPCYCGCQRSGHRGNDDCFVMSRAANGDVTEWEPHGMT